VGKSRSITPAIQAYTEQVVYR